MRRQRNRLLQILSMIWLRETRETFEGSAGWVRSAWVNIGPTPWLLGGDGGGCGGISGGEGGGGGTAAAGMTE